MGIFKFQLNLFSLIILPKQTVGHGQCSSDSVWASIWGKEIQGNGHHLPESNHPTLGSSSPSHLPLLVLRSIPPCNRPIRQHIGTRPNFRSWIDPSTLCICHKLSNAEVPPGTEHCEPFSIYGCWGFLLACSPDMASSLCPGLWPSWSSPYTEFFLVDSGCCDCTLHTSKPLLQGNLDWLFFKSF